MRSNELFNPSDEHRMLRETVADFARREVEPQAAEHDQLGTLNVNLFRRLGDLGLLGITIPEEAGGAGMDAVAAVIVHHELSKVDPGFCLAYLAHAMLFANNLARNGDEDQKQRFLPRACSGKIGRASCRERV